MTNQRTINPTSVKETMDECLDAIQTSIALRKAEDRLIILAVIDDKLEEVRVLEDDTTPALCSIFTGLGELYFSLIEDDDSPTGELWGCITNEILFDENSEEEGGVLLATEELYTKFYNFCDLVDGLDALYPPEKVKQYVDDGYHVIVTFDEENLESSVVKRKPITTPEELYIVHELVSNLAESSDDLLRVLMDKLESIVDDLVA